MNFIARFKQRVHRKRTIGKCRLIDERHDESRLMKCEIPRGFPEIRPAGRFDAVLSATKIRHVDVFEQQPWPRKLMLDPKRHDDVADFFDLSRWTTGAIAKMFGDLHRQRRRT